MLEDDKYRRGKRDIVQITKENKNHKSWYMDQFGISIYTCNKFNTKPKKHKVEFIVFREKRSVL